MSDKEAVLEWIQGNREELAAFVLEFGNTYSPRGYEGEASDFLYEWLRERDVDAHQQPVVGDRQNVVGTIRGSGGDGGDDEDVDSDDEETTTERGGEDLLFNAHLDTAYGNPAEDEWVVPERHRIDSEAWREGEYLLGDDVVNDKGPMAAFVWAALAIREAGVELAGDLHLTGTVGEIGGATVDEFQDTRVLGTGIGSRHLVDAGITADYALVAECTDYAVARMEAGVVWFEITIRANATYVPLLANDDSGSFEADHPGAVPKAARATLELERWAAEYCRENTVEYDHGTMRPAAGVGALRTGNPYAPAKTPGIATLYLDVRLPPGKGPDFVREDVEAILSEAGIDATVEPYMFRRGHVAPEAVDPLTDSIAGAFDAVRGGTPPRPKPHVTSMWRDSNVFNELGIPSVNCGPPRSPEAFSSTRKQNALRVDDLLDITKIYALTAMEICG